MKLIVFLSCFLLPFIHNNVNAQTPITKFPVDTVNQLIAYTEVINVDNTTTKELHSRAMHWSKKSFANFAEVFKEAQSDDSKIVLKTKTETFGQKNGLKVVTAIVYYTITISFKDGKYKYIINKLMVDAPTPFGIEKWTKIQKEHPDKEKIYSNLKQVDTLIKKQIAELKKVMEKAEQEKNDENW
jgi:hypothetical protein